MATNRNVTIQKYFPTPYSNVVEYSRIQEGWNGDKVTPYPYRGRECRSIPGNKYTNGVYDYRDANNAPSVVEFFNRGGVPPWAQPGANQAYERFRDQALGNKSQLGTFAAEWRESLGTVRKRSLSLYQAARSLRKGNFSDFLDHLGAQALPTHRSKKGVKKAVSVPADTWLEYWFFWAPTVADMSNAANVLERPLPGGKYRGRSRSYKTKTFDAFGVRYGENAIISHQVVADVHLSNPNLFLASQLGIVNPASVAWEVVPFSFVVDWFVDFGGYLGSFTDFVGTTVSNACTTHTMVSHDTWLQLNPGYSGGPAQVFADCQIRKMGVLRPVPNLQIRANLGHSLTRAATAVSLLTSALSGMKGKG